MTDAERNAQIQAGFSVTSERHLESYLFDDEILTLLANQEEKPLLAPNLIAAKQTALAKRGDGEVGE